MLRTWMLVLAAAPAAAQTVPAQPIPSSAQQLVVVTTPSWTSTTGQMVRFERQGAGWRRMGRAVPVVVGRGGLGWGRGLHGPGVAHGTGLEGGGPFKLEGDGRAPAGVFALPEAFGYAAAVATGLPYLPTDADVECVDDPASRSYNRIVRRDTVAADYQSHEEMRLSTDAYRRGVVVAHNDPRRGEALPRRGSCIFVHQWSGPQSPTAGCTAMAAPHLDALVGWLDARRAPVLVQLTAATYRRVQQTWHLPPLRP